MTFLVCNDCKIANPIRKFTKRCQNELLEYKTEFVNDCFGVEGGGGVD